MVIIERFYPHYVINTVSTIVVRNSVKVQVNGGNTLWLLEIGKRNNENYEISICRYLRNRFSIWLKSYFIELCPYSYHVYLRTSSYKNSLLFSFAGVSASEALRNGLCQSLWGASASRPEPRISPHNLHETYPVRGKYHGQLY